MRLGELLASAGIECPKNSENLEIRSIVTDSRRATDGCMFIALKGHNTDGHDYINEAVKKGAVVIVAEQVRDVGVGGAAVVKTDNTAIAAALLYNSQCGYPSKKLKITGVTGTNGKTSVCAALEAIYLAAGKSCAVIGTTGCRINGRQSSLSTGGLTTPVPSELYPLLAELARQKIEYVFMEISSHALALGRVDGLEFECGIFTNLTRDHLDFHGNMENYFLAKARLFEKCKRRIINTDDLYGRRIFGKYGGISVSVRERADVFAYGIKNHLYGSSYTLCMNGSELAVSIPAIGDFGVINTLEAAAAALDGGIPASAVEKALSRFRGAVGRMERIALPELGFDVIIDYAHTPDALEKVLMNVHAVKRGDGRIILVFGCGGDRDRGKRREMAHIASRLADFCIVTSDNPRSEKPEAIINDILKGIDKEKPHISIVSRREAIVYALSLARSGDTVLLCGKGHENYEIDANGKHPFDEKKIVSDWTSENKR